MATEDLDLNFDDVSLSDVSEDELDGVDLSSFGEIDDTIDKPHFKVATKVLKDVLKVAKTLCASGGRDIISKSICLQSEGDKVVCKMTDFDVYLKVSMERLNSENILTEPVVIPTDILIKLCKAVPVNTIIFKDGDIFKIRLYGGDMALETFSVDVAKFDFTDPVEDKGEQISSKVMYSMMKDFTPIVTAAVAPTERRILCEKNKALAVYLWGIMMDEEDFSDMDLKIKDLAVLKTLTVNTDETLQVFQTKSDVKVVRKLIKGSNFEYAFLVSDAKISDTLKSGISSVVTDDGVYVDFVQLYKIIEVASDLPYTIGKVGLNYNDEGIALAVKTKKGDSLFTLNGSSQGTVTPIAEELVVSAKLLRVFLRSFATQSSVKLTVSTGGLGIACEDYKAAIYPESK